nr:hypothetical protein [Tanacetum cinerariifolium]
MAQMRAAAPSTHHSLLPSETPPLLPIPLPVPSTSQRAEILEADTPPQKRLLLTAPRPGCEVGESSVAAAMRQPGPTMARSKDYVAVRADIEVLRRERLAYEQESIQIHEALARSEAYGRTLEARVAKMAPKRTTRSTQVSPVTPAPTTTTTTVTKAQLQALINQGVAASMAEAEASRVRNGYDNNGSGPRLAQAVQSDRFEKYIGGLPDTIHDSVKAAKPKTMQEAIEFAT